MIYVATSVSLAPPGMPDTAHVIPSHRALTGGAKAKEHHLQSIEIRRVVEHISEENKMFAQVSRLALVVCC